jgi:hypothetical protein
MWFAAKNICDDEVLGNFATFLACLSHLVYNVSIKSQPSPRVEQEINTPYATSSFDDFVITERVFDLR